MKLTLKKKISAILMSTFTFAALIGLCFTASIAMTRNYYDTIFVSGSSMNPTLYGGTGGLAKAPYIDEYNEYHSGEYVNFGLVDKSEKAKKNIRRYDIVTTYYPSDYDGTGKLIESATYKIKRVIALPGETFRIVNGVLSVKTDGAFVVVERKHLIDDGGQVDIKDITERTLNENEYWVLGDHRSDSSDSGTMKRPVTLNMITGVVVRIEGTAEFYYHYVCENCEHEINEKDVLYGRVTKCDKCGGAIVTGKGDIRNRHYTFPKIV